MFKKFSRSGFDTQPGPSRNRRTPRGLRLRLLATALVAGVVLAAPVVSLAQDGSLLGQTNVKVETPQQIERVFVEARLRVAAGQPRQAVVLFRAILARHPDLVRVRLELARAYFLSESWSESRAEFVAVLSGDLPDTVRQNVLRFINNIDARRGFDWSASVGFSLAGEAGRNYKTDTVVLNFFGVPLPFKVKRPDTSSGIGVAVNTSAEVRQPVFEEDGVRGVAFAQGFANLFDAQGSTVDDHRIGGATGLRMIWPRTTAAVSTNFAVREYGGDIDESRFGVTAAAEQRTADGLSYFGSAGAASVDRRGGQFRDGSDYRLRLGISKSLAGSANVSVAATLGRFEAKGDWESYDSYGVELRGRTDIGWGLRADATARVTRESYDEIAPIFFERRADNRVSLDLELVKTDMFILGQYSPFVSLGVTRNTSTIEFNSYDEARFLVGFQSAF